MSIKRLLIYGMTLLVFVTVGCGKQPITGTSPSYAEGVLWKFQFYGMNQTHIDKVGKQLGVVQKFVNGAIPSTTYGETISNEFHVGTKIYAVPGKNTSKFIACQSSRGGYVEMEAVSAVQ